MNVFTKMAQTITNLLTAADTAVNMVNRGINTADQYVQTVERHAVDYNYSSQLVSAKRREQLEEQYRLLSENEKVALRKAIQSENPFDSLVKDEKVAA